MLSIETKQSIIEHLKNKNLTQSEIADKHGCSYRTVQRAATANGLNYGRGISNHWDYTGPSIALSYLLGFYLADGYLGKRYRHDTINALYLYTTTPEIANHLQGCIKNIGQEPNKRTKSNGPKSTELMIEVGVYSCQFARWINQVCKGKDRIPQLIFEASQNIRIAFLSALIDGDGSVCKRGYIRFRNSYDFIENMPRLLQSLDIRTGGIHTVSRLESGKIYRELSVRRDDFIESGGRLYHPVKQHRILHA